MNGNDLIKRSDVFLYLKKYNNPHVAESIVEAINAIPAVSGEPVYQFGAGLVDADNFRRLQLIEKEALNLIKGKGRHNTEIAMNRLIYACHKDDEDD